jgi:hypothetical protein
VVDRDGEEAWIWPGVEVHRQHPVDAGELEHVGYEAGGDRSRGFAYDPGARRGRAA